MLDDTIVALGTPPGESGVAVVRMSGPRAADYALKLFQPVKAQDMTQKPGHTLTLGWLTDEGGQAVDQVLLALMYAPHSYTGEHTAEFHCHGGMSAVRACIRLCLQAGARLAAAGEFTQRAYLKDKIDLTQAEAIIDVIKAGSEKSLKIAVGQLKGRLRQQIEAVEDNFVELNALLLASMDFPEEMGNFDRGHAEAIVRRLQEQLEQLLRTAARNEIYRQGVRLVICGKPNVGKSSLLNYLLDQDKAIVTDIPGTTRDVVEDYIYMRGLPVRVMDTAGLRPTQDVVEQIGVEKTKEAIEQADIILFLLDAATGITGEDQRALAEIKAGKDSMVLVVNKTDAGEIADAAILGLPISARIAVKTGQGLEQLQELIADKITGGDRNDDMDIMVNLRQRQAMEQCREQVGQLLLSIGTQPLDCLSVDVQTVLDSLGEISGKNLAEEIVDRIFRDFCIGK
jgi:tRNA modification GTPase